MKCPFCSHIEDRVIDSRTVKDGEAIRRRRECLKCERRFTSYERVVEILPMIVKKDSRREPYDRHKVLNGLEKACEKRPISIEVLENAVDSIERKLLGLGVKEVQSSFIGETVMSTLRDLDKVAYIRFASVYLEFQDIDEFMNEIKGLFANKEIA